MGDQLLKIIFNLVCFFLLLTACEIKTASDIKIDGGNKIGPQSKNKIPGIFQISTNRSLCTAQAVSRNTLLTAAHCVEDISGRGLCINSGKNTNICTTQVYIPDEYKNNLPEKMAFDVALAYFDEDIFEQYFAIRHTDDSIKADEDFLLVGYSDKNVECDEFGCKHWGANTVNRFVRESINKIDPETGEEFRVFVTEEAVTIESRDIGGHTVSPGDSGGAAFDREFCSVIGVASRMGQLRFLNGKETKVNLHANLMWRSNFDWLVNSTKKHNPDMYICGLHGWDSYRCDLKGMYYPVRNELLNEDLSGLDLKKEVPCITVNTLDELLKKGE